MRLPRKTSLVVALALIACNSATPPTAPDAVPALPGAPAPIGTSVTGRFVKTRYDVTGTATVVIANGVAQLDLSADFSIAQTPGPSLYINTTNNPNTGTPIRVTSLKGISGAQRYIFAVPPGTRYTWLVIWCDPFNVPMAEAPIPATP